MKSALAWLLLILSFNLAAQPKELLVGVEDIDYYPLFDFSSNDTNRPSFARDLLSSFFEHHNIAYKFVPLPVKRFDKWYIEQNIDFKFPDNFRWREDHSNKLNITFSEPIIKLTAGTFVLEKNSQLTRNKIKRLGTILGFYPTLWLPEVKSGKVTLMEEPSPLAVVRHLVYGNSDAINLDPNVIRHNLNKLKLSDKVVLAGNIYHQEYYYHFSSIKYPEVILLFNQYLQDNKALVDSLKQKYNIVE